MFAFAGDVTPTGFLACDGSAVSRTLYPDLWAAIGAAHGAGDGSTTFNVPDYRGRFLRGVDGAAGRDPDATARLAPCSGPPQCDMPSGNAGNAVGSVEGDDFGQHSHSVPWAMNTGGTAPGVTSVGSGLNGVSSGPAPLTGGLETRPKNAAVAFIIKF